VRPSPRASLPLLALLLPLLSASSLAAQTGEAWNSQRVLELVARARAVRHSAAVDPGLHSYQGEARGYVYFFIDRPDSDERTLVKADQVAVELFWEAPNRTKQRIVGLRDEKVLPTNIRYHLDHLTVVQDDFGDHIRLGDGDEVERVLHPAGPDSEAAYDFLLADSLSITYGDGAEEVRVYEIRVRPKNFDRPGIIGSVFVDRTTASIVRMNFTFTPTSYVDPYLDYIRISLDNSLWMGKYWLPYRQEAEVRREMPMLDFLAGSIIRGRFEIGRYDFNTRLDPTLFLGRRVTAAPEAERLAFPFTRGLFDDLAEGGLAPSPTMDEIRAQARRMVRERVLSGLRPLRMQLGTASDLVRYDRAEGLFVGASASLRPAGDVLMRATAGYASGRDDVAWSLSATGGPDPIVPTLEIRWNGAQDMGLPGAASGVVNSLASTLGIEDYSDLYFVRGARLRFASREAGGTELSLRWEDHRSARDVVSDAPGDFRPVRPIDEGRLGEIEITTRFGLPGAGRLRVRGGWGRLKSRSFTSIVADGAWSREDTERGWRLDFGASAGAVSGAAPAQRLFLLGGRGTLPGYGYRSFVGDRFWLLHAEGTVPLAAPWVGLRVFTALGAARLNGRTLPDGWLRQDSSGLRASVGAGLTFGWDVLRLDLGRGVRGGRWEAIFSVAPRFRAWL
jgi:hypothetical protein